MIVTVSRKTDIVMYYGSWFLKRLEEGFFLVPDLYNIKSFSKIELKDIEGFVFFTRNAREFRIFIDQLDKLDIPYYFIYSITDYKRYEDFDLREQIRNLYDLSKRVGKEKVHYQYGPVIINEYYSLEDNLKSFAFILSFVRKYVSRVSIRFFENFTKVSKRDQSLDINLTNQKEVLEEFKKVASKLGVELNCCMDGLYSCVDNKLLVNSKGEHLKYLNKVYKLNDKCGCCFSVDVGSYSTCPACCTFCYSYRDLKTVKERYQNRDDNRACLYDITDIKIRERSFESLKTKQDSLF